MKNQINKINTFLREQKEKISAFLKKLGQDSRSVQFKAPSLKIPSFAMSGGKMPSASEGTLRSIVIFQTLLIIGGLSFGGWFYWTKMKNPEGPKKRELPQALVEALPVELGTFETFTSVVGTLKSNESIIVRPEVEGVIKQVNFKSGASVSKGDILFVLEDGVYRAMKKEAQSKVELWKGK